jgi:hypothetical protein
LSQFHFLDWQWFHILLSFFFLTRLLLPFLDNFEVKRRLKKWTEFTISERSFCRSTNIRNIHLVSINILCIANLLKKKQTVHVIYFKLYSQIDITFAGLIDCPNLLFYWISWNISNLSLFFFFFFFFFFFSFVLSQTLDRNSI